MRLVKKSSSQMDYLDIENLTVKELKTLAKQHRLNLKSNRKEKYIMLLIENYLVAKHKVLIISIST